MVKILSYLKYMMSLQGYKYILVWNYVHILNNKVFESNLLIYLLIFYI